MADSGAVASSSTVSDPSAALPDPTLPAPPLEDDEEGFTAAQLIQRQADLELAAREAVPFSFTKGGCTYERGYIRQPVYACRTCGGGGVCAGCSVGCHADHDLVELFAKRAFRCDCGTLSLCQGNDKLERDLKPCSLRSKELNFAPQNDENIYGQNFHGVFCRCERGKTYDAETEEETMFQCLCCEDWVHESCTSIRPGQSPFEDINAHDRMLADGPLVDHDAFDSFICNECVRKPENAILRNYLGARGWIVCLPEQDTVPLPDHIDDIPGVKVTARGNGWHHSWHVYGLPGGIVSADASTTLIADTSSTATSIEAERPQIKRKAEEDASTQEPSAKKTKRSDGLIVEDSFSDNGEAEETPLISVEDICTEPDVPLFAQHETRLDVFLTTDFRNRICRCKSCALDWQALPYLLKPEETYSPPRSQADSPVNDGQSETGASQTSSTYDLGLAALSQLPREQMMESLQAYNKMRDALFDHLRPFAEQGKVVDADSVREFFRRQRENSQRNETGA